MHPVMVASGWHPSAGCRQEVRHGEPPPPGYSEPLDGRNIHSTTSNKNSTRSVLDFFGYLSTGADGSGWDVNKANFKARRRGQWDGHFSEGRIPGDAVEEPEPARMRSHEGARRENQGSPADAMFGEVAKPFLGRVPCRGGFADEQDPVPVEKHLRLTMYETRAGELLQPDPGDQGDAAAAVTGGARKNCTRAR